MTKRILSVLLAFSLLFSCFTCFAAAEEAALLQGAEVDVGDYETPFDDSRFFQYGEYTLHFRVLQAQNPVGQIMMIHGFALSSWCWTNLAEILVQNGYTCVLVDLPDFGYSTRETASTARLPRQKLVYELMTYLSEDAWIVAGHSMGGYIALSLLQEYPEIVSSLLLYGTSGNNGMSKGMQTFFTMQPVAALFGGLMQLFAGTEFIFNAALRAGLQDDTYYALYEKEFVTEPLAIDGTGRGAVYSMASLPATDFPALRTCHKPIFYCNGSLDNVISADARTKLAAHLPSDSVKVTVEGGGHMFIENMASAVGALTLDFLG